jgi:glycosyltransferase involved in cell wall biosynthesis
MTRTVTEAHTLQSGNIALPLVSVVVLTFNEEVNLPACLNSLSGLDCEIFIVDSGSTDRTLEIAKDSGAKLAAHPFENYSVQRNWAQRNLPIRSDWVLHLDADERLTPTLVAAINAKLSQSSIQEAGFLLCKRTIFMGRWIKHGAHYPSYHLRLFRRAIGVCEDRLYDQHFVVDGSVAVLPGDYLDVVASSVNSWSVRHTRWARCEADEMMTSTHTDRRVRPDPLGNAIERKRWMREGIYGRAPLFLRAFAYFFYRYIVRLGFLDGTEGLIFHFLQGCWFRFLVDCEIFERSKGR